MMRRWIFASLVLFGIVGIFFVRAQAANPTTVAFTASADHSATQGGVAILTRYELRVTPQGGTAVTRLDLGKPTPDGSNTITVVNAGFFNGLAPATYTAVVAAIGPGGEGVSAASDPFPVGASIPRAGGKPVIR